MSLPVPILEVTLVAPDGTRFDVSDRMSDVGTLTESVEEDLADFTKGDLDFELDDGDGRVEAFLGNAQPDEYYTVEIWRDLGVRNDPRARRGIQYLFLGLIDLPWSIEYDRKQGLVSFQVYSLTSLLERTSVEHLRRALTPGEGSVSAGSRDVTVEDTTGIASGDEIELADSVRTETQTVARVVSATVVRTREAWSATFSAAGVQVMTPYSRWVAPAALAATLIEAAGCLPGEITTDPDLSPVPFVSPMNANGLPYGGLPLGGVAETGEGELSIYASGGLVGDVGLYVGNPRSGDSFTFTANASQPASGDWTPYLLTRPANFPSGIGWNDNGSRAWNHTGNTSYSITLDILGGTDSRFSVGTGGLVDQYVGTGSYSVATVEYDPINHRIWASYRRADGSRSITEVYDIAGASWSDVTGSEGGYLRMCRSLGVMIWMSEDRQTVKLYDPTSKAVLRTITGVFPEAPARLIPWTFRHLRQENGPGHILACYKLTGRVRIRVWSVDWDVLADFDAARAYPDFPTTPPFPPFNQTINPYLAGYNDPEIGPCLIFFNGYTEPEWGIISTRYAGVIPYADLEGDSAASALKEIALLSVSFVTADHDTRHVHVKRRNLASPPRLTFAEDPLDSSELPVSDMYRTSAEVTGESASGSFSAVSGANPARRLSIASKFAQSESLALVIANAYRASLSAVGRERQVTYEDDGTIIRPLDVVRIENENWIVLSSELDLRDHERELRLLRVPS